VRGLIESLDSAPIEEDPAVAARAAVMAAQERAEIVTALTAVGVDEAVADSWLSDILPGRHV
jgi:hypothetical protein